MTKIYEESKGRAPSQRQVLLKILKEAGAVGVLNSDLVKVCIGYRSRLAEMYQSGYIIEVEHVERGLCRYTLISEPESERTPDRAIDTLFSIVNNEYSGSLTADQLREILAQNNFNIVRRHGSHKQVI